MLSRQDFFWPGRPESSAGAERIRGASLSPDAAIARRLSPEELPPSYRAAGFPHAKPFSVKCTIHWPRHSATRWFPSCWRHPVNNLWIGEINDIYGIARKKTSTFEGAAKHPIALSTRLFPVPDEPGMRFSNCRQCVACSIIPVKRSRPFPACPGNSALPTPLEVTPPKQDWQSEVFQTLWGTKKSGQGGGAFSSTLSGNGIPDSAFFVSRGFVIRS